MIRTSVEELGEAYQRASKIIMDMEPVTPRIMGALWRKHFGLFHKHSKDMFGHYEYWIEFPDERDYTAFVLRFG